MTRKMLLALQTLAVGYCFLVALASAADSKSGAGTKSGRDLSRDDTNFITEAAQGGLMEVELGKVAAKKGSAKGVKDFGQRMQKDHSKANAALKKIAANKGVKVPAALEGKHKSTVERLSKLSGAEFDREYMQTMVDDHKEDVEKFERQTDKGDDPDVKRFAGEQLPILKKHLELARTVNEQVERTGKKTR